jgi:hypothetical protein
MAWTDAEQIQHLTYERDQINERYNVQFNRMIGLRENNDRLRTELDIVKGLIGCLTDDQRKAMNADWILARINAALEIQPE